MSSMIRITLIFWFSCLFFTAGNGWALTPEQVISLKKAGVDDQTIQLMIKQEQESAAKSTDETQGRKEITDKDGKTAVIYSTGRRTESKGSKEEEKKTEKAWEMLNNIIIDSRTTK